MAIIPPKTFDEVMSFIADLSDRDRLAIRDGHKIIKMMVELQNLIPQVQFSFNPEPDRENIDKERLLVSLPGWNRWKGASPARFYYLCEGLKLGYTAFLEKENIAVNDEAKVRLVRFRGPVEEKK